MSRRRAGDRVLGPYPDGDGWRVVVVRGGGGRTSRRFPTEEEARRVATSGRRQLEAELGLALTVGAALDRYELARRAKGNRPGSIATTLHRLRAFLGDQAAELRTLTPARLRALYDARAKVVTVDTHRNELAEAKTFFRWTVEQRLLARNPAEAIAGVGRRRRGKEQLRVDEARRWLEVALEQARTKPGAVGALMAMLMGLRASEIVDRVVRDLDDDGRLLWIPEAKTEAGRRRLVVPELLRPHLQRLATGRGPGEPLLGAAHERSWVAAWTARLCRAAGVPEITAHGLRGTHATLAESAGATGDLVAAALGHESAATTHGHYTRPEAVGQATQTRTLTVLSGGKKT